MLARRDQLSAVDMLDAARRALRYATEVDQEQFNCDEMRVDAAMNAIAVVGEASKRISPDGRRELAGIDWRKYSDLRQFVVHKYFLVEPLELRTTILEDLPPLIEILSNALESGRNP